MQYRQITKDLLRRVKRQKNITKKHFSNFLEKTTLKITNKSHEIKDDICKSKIRNICLSSGLPRSVLSEFNVSRHVFKKHATQAKFPGIRKASW